MANIKKIQAYEIIDSSGSPTIEGRLILDNGIEVTTSIPAGSSIGKYEAVELRDNDQKRFEGMGVTQAVSYINDLIGPKLVGISPLKQQEVDLWLVKADGTKNKSRLGANTTLTISQLMAKAAARDSGLPVYKYLNLLYEKMFKSKIILTRIPSPIFSMINGGKHANNTLDFQEFQLVPSSSFTYTQAYQTGIEILQGLKEVLQYRNANISVGEEGGFTPNLLTNVDAIEIVIEAVRQKNLKIGLDIFLGIDVAASHFFREEHYIIKDKPNPLKPEEFLDFIKHITKTYSVLVLEDPLNQDDWENWKKLNQTISKEIYLVGDDLLSSNKERLLKAIKEKSCSSILIKPNQIGTITENMEVIDLAKKNSFSFIFSQRSSETNDSFIADFAVAMQSDFVKFGAPVRGERVAKYNRLWQIEREGFKTA